MENKKLSIIIITLNEEKNITNILSDLKCQTFQNFEIMVSDSRSSDNTEKVVDNFKENIKNLTFVNCKKIWGPSYRRNFGVKYAKYERLLFGD